MSVFEKLFARLFGEKKPNVSESEVPKFDPTVVADSSLFPDEIREQMRALNTKAKWPGQERIEQLEAALSEADRRAGAAEREAAWMRSGANARQSWLDKAKDRAGYDRNVSFDVVFDDLLDARDALRKALEWLPIETAPDGAIVLLAGEMDGPGDWRIKCGYRDETERSGWKIWGASWEPRYWMHLPPHPERRVLICAGFVNFSEGSWWPRSVLVLLRSWFRHRLLRELGMASEGTCRAGRARAPRGDPACCEGG